MPGDPFDAGPERAWGTVRDAAERDRFELEVGGLVLFADCARAPGLLVVRYVYAPPSLRGTGAAGHLMAAIAGAARAEDRRIRALCGYARAWLRGREVDRGLLID